MGSAEQHQQAGGNGPDQRPGVVFMGTPDFATTVLDGLIKHGVNVVGVITAPDKPAGRGRKIHESSVKKYALSNDLRVLQPTNLKDSAFIEELKTLKADLQIVVAFRMLPEVVWAMPPMGTFNLHASLLPQYRGAAPINWAVINGEKETGVTTFFLQHQIDTGDIIMQEKVKIGESMTAGELHDELMTVGSDLVNKTYDAIVSGSTPTVAQESLIEGKLKEAPKIFKQDCKVNWHDPVLNIYNFIRGMSPFPTAWTELQDENNTVTTAKLFEADFNETTSTKAPGTIDTDGKTYLHIYAKGGYISIKTLQLQGKKRMALDDFLRGSNINNSWQTL